MSEVEIRSKTLTIKAGEVGLALMAWGDAQGRKNTMTAYRIGRQLETLRELQTHFVETVSPWVDEKGQQLQDEDTGELLYTEELNEACEEEVTFTTEPIRLSEIEDLGWEQPDALSLLVRLGLVCKCGSAGK